MNPFLLKEMNFFRPLYKFRRIKKIFNTIGNLSSRFASGFTKFFINFLGILYVKLKLKLLLRKFIYLDISFKRIYIKFHHKTGHLRLNLI